MGNLKQNSVPLSRLRLNTCFADFYRVALITLSLLFLNAAHAQPTNFVLGTTNLLVGPAAGSNSVVLVVTPVTAAWTNAANVAWLNLSRSNQAGTGSTNVVFGFDANLGATRTGTLTIAGQILTVTQAGSTYTAAQPLVILATGLSGPSGVAVDATGNVYFPDTGRDVVDKWIATNNTVITLVSGGLYRPFGVAVDGVGNVYIADTDNNAIKEWTAADSNVTTIVSSGLFEPYGVAVDGGGNVYIADTYNGAIKKLSLGNTNLTILVSGLFYPGTVAVDLDGNVYFSSSGAIEEWTAANSNVTTLVSVTAPGPGVAVDGSGNVYIADAAAGMTFEWTVANNAAALLASSGFPESAAVDGADNVYIADINAGAIFEVPHAFVDPSVRVESPAAGNDVLPVVLPVTANLLPPFTPTSDQSWLAITGITNGVVSFSVSANPGLPRIGSITLLGQAIPVVQVSLGPPLNLIAFPTAANGAFSFAFGSPVASSFTVLSSTDLSLPLTNWTVAGVATNIAPELFEFTAPPTTNTMQSFYQVRSP